MMAIEKSQFSPSTSAHGGEVNPKEGDKADQCIHSGQFMISRVHDANVDDDDDDSEDEINPSDFDPKGYSFKDASKETADTYKFGDRSSHTLAIDASLTKLFQCMTLAYSGKITSPRWKMFRGLHLTMKDKVRLNNIIWREWCMQYIYGRRPIICQFATPLSDDIHTKPEAIVLEGKYWKRRLDTVTAEYKKWRKFFKARLLRRTSMDKTEAKTNRELLNRLADVLVVPSTQQQSATDLLIPSSLDLMDIDFSSDTLFNSLNQIQGFAFPNPREITGMGVADLIQPGLIPLQPPLEDFMDTYDPLQEILNMRSQNGNSTINLQGNDGLLLQQPSLSSDSLQTASSSDIHTSQSLPISLDILQQPGNNNGSVVSALLSGLLSDARPADVEQLLVQQQNTQTAMASLPVTFDLNHPSPETASSSSNTSGDTLSPLQQALLGRNPVLKQPALSNTSAIGKSKSAPVMNTHPNKENANKKEVFAVPKKPVSSRKPRTIAPATTATLTPSNVSTPSQQSTYLAQLLTTGTYKGALITVKKESQTGTDSSSSSSSSSSLQTIQPTNTSSITAAPIVVTPVFPDFHTNVLLQAASQALGSTSVKSKEATSAISSVQVPKAAPAAIKEASTPEKAAIDSPQDSPLSYSLSSPKSSFSIESFGKSENGEDKAELRQKSHISAEQKRRCNIKSGFDLLHTLIPSLNQNPNAKVSKAAMLQKTAEYCKKLKSERTQMQNEAEILRQEIESLNVQISQCQSQLPATGAPVTRQRVDQMKEMFEEYVKNRTLNNWKFWIFSTIIRGLFDSFNNMVSTASMDELCRTTLAWLDQHCSLVALRPTVLNALRNLSTTTSILSDPSKMPQQATEAVIKGNNKSPPT